MKKSHAMILLVLALILGFGAAMGYYLLEKRRYEKTIAQMQAANLQNVYRVHEFRKVTGLNDDGNKMELFYVNIPQDLPLPAQLNMLARALSAHCFDYLPVEVKGIQESVGKKIAIINLREFEGFETTNNSTGPSWATGFFQGSTGGASTSTILIESFLQQENPLPWIDGVVFLYEEHALTSFDHVEALTKTSFRQQVYHTGSFE